MPSEKENAQNYDPICNSKTQDFGYEEYEEEIEIKAADLSKYVENAEELLKIKKINIEELD